MTDKTDIYYLRVVLGEFVFESQGPQAVVMENFHKFLEIYDEPAGSKPVEEPAELKH